MMLEGKGISVIDLGVNVSAEAFVSLLPLSNAMPDLICCSRCSPRP